MSDTSPIYPNITVKLSGEDGNAFAIIGRVAAALRRGGIAPSQVKAFYEQATLGDYNHLIEVCMKWVKVR